MCTSFKFCPTNPLYTMPYKMFTSNSNLPAACLAAIKYNSKVNIKKTENEAGKYKLSAIIQYNKLMCEKLAIKTLV